MLKSRRRRWPWIVLAGVGVLAVSWPWLLPAVTSYLAAGLDDRDKYSSVYALPVGIASLLVSVAGLWQSRREPHRPDAPTTPGPVGTPGMTSLDASQVSAAERVRGRDALITELTRACRRGARRSSRVHVLHGMGGAGKTTIALHVAHQVRQQGVTVWWIAAARATDLRVGLRQLTQTLGATRQELDRDWADRAPDVLWSRLHAHPGRWLLILDNADDLDLLTAAGDTVAAARGWVRPPATRRGTILVTSRDGNPAAWGEWCDLHAVGMLADADGARVLTDLTGAGAGTHQEAERLAARLGGLPLALTLAGHYLADAGRVRLPGAISTFPAYQQALDRSGLAAVFPTPPANSGRLTDAQARAVITHTWELSLPLLERRGLAPAVTLLRLLSLFAGAPVPYDLLLDPATIAASPLFPDAGFPEANAVQVRAWLDGLATLNLITLDTSPAATTPASLRLHPLIRDASRHHLTAEQTPGLYRLAAGLLDLATTDDQTFRQPGAWPTWQLISPHPLALLTDIAAQAHPDPVATASAADAAVRVTEYFAATGQYVTARAQAQAIRHACGPILEAEHPTVLEADEALAHWTGAAGDVVAARDRYAALLPIRERVLGAEHSDTLITRANLAQYTGVAGDFVAARDQYAALLPICERVLGAEHSETLTVRANVAESTGETGDFVAARDQYTALLPIRERVSGPEHPETLAARANLARWTGEAGDSVAAGDQYAALLPIRVKVSGAEHPDTLTIRSSIALWTGEAGDPVAARDQYAAMLPIRQRVSGAEHPDTLADQAGFAYWIGEAGDPVAARDACVALLPIYERVLGVDHPETLAVRAGIAQWSGEAGDAFAARDQYAALVPIREQVSGAEHRETLTIRANLASWSGEAGDPAAAQAQYEVLLPIYERVLGTKHPETQVVREALAYWSP